MLSIICLLALVCANPGVSIGVSQGALDEAKAIALPIIFSNFSSAIMIDRVDIKGGYLSHIEVTLKEPSVDTFEINLRYDSNIIEVRTNKLALYTKANFHYKLGFVKTKGRAEISVSDVNFDLQLELGQQTGHPSYTVAPMVKVKRLSLGVSSHHTHIKLHGDLITQIAKVLEPLLQDTFEKSIIKDVQK